MKLRILIVCTLLAPFLLTAQPPMLTRAQYREDFDLFWKHISVEYCYFNKKQTDWQRVKELYAVAADSIKNRSEFVALLEKVLYEIYDHHAILNTNINSSFRLIPSGTDMWAEYIDGRPVITAVRNGFGAASAGIATGMEVIAVNDTPVLQAVEALLPRSLKTIDNEARSFVLRLLLAGKHNEVRKITLLHKGKVKDYYPDKSGLRLERVVYASMVESRRMGTTGYIKINDCLYDDDLIPAFDSVMRTMQNSASLILDLRETPGGGNTVVARAILGWFISKDHFFQKHEYFAEEKISGIKRSWMEIVSPRSGKCYGKPLVVLCGRWTGSVGEGITIGFDALQRRHTRIIGTAMAGLNGAVYTQELPNTKIRVTFPAERLYHINGLPREAFVPATIVEQQPGAGGDPVIESALQFLKLVK